MTILRSVNDLKDFKIVATEGEIGTVEEFIMEEDN